MANTVFFMRHGKAANVHEYDDDFMRPLIDSGQLESLHAALQLNQKHKINYVICSPAIRTMQTARIALRAVNLNLSHLVVIPQLYMGSFGHYLDAINAVQNNSNILVIGHNPALGQMAIHFGLEQTGFKTSEIAGFEYKTAKLELTTPCKLVFTSLRK